MRKISAFIVILFFFQNIIAQKILQLSSGKLAMQKIQNFDSSNFWNQQNPTAGKYFCVVSFSQIITPNLRNQLLADGIYLHDFIPPNAYSASVSAPLQKNILAKNNIDAIAFLSPTLKISNTLLHPEKYISSPKTTNIQVLVKLSDGINIETAKQILSEKNFPCQPFFMEQYGVLQCNIFSSQLNDLATLPFVEWIEPSHPNDHALNNSSRNGTAGNIAAAPFALGGYALTGSGVVGGVGDDADPTSNIDLVDRVINRTGFTYEFHGTHVAGTVAGAGIGRYLSKGFAPSAKIVSSIFGGIYQNAGNYVSEYGMVATNNSYGNITGDPELAGTYDLYSRTLDLQAYQYPELLHVFAAGNDGYLAIPGFPFHYSTVLASYQSSKNVLDVGNAQPDLQAEWWTSCGPTKDGRLKPEIMARGDDIISCGPNNTYGGASGTSQAAPGVTGGILLLEEQYKKLHAGANAKSALLKLLAMNGAKDLEAKGADFRTGYGYMNLKHSLDIMTSNRYFSNIISTGGVQSQNVVVPTGLAQFKAMVYWHDPAASIFAIRSLVNDLDLEVIDPLGNIILPQKLDTIPANVTTVATTGADHINNSEQVIIYNPIAGNYTIRIKGTAINVNPSQEYFCCYDYVAKGLNIYYPWEADAVWPGETEYIHWENNGTAGCTKKLEYSLDDGNTWLLIANAIPDSVLTYPFTFPNGSTTTGKFRITDNTNGQSYTSGHFILQTSIPFSFAPINEQCEGYCKINWPSIFGADSYEILMKQGPDLVSMGITTDTSFTISGLNKDSTYWISMRCIKNGLPARRNNAVPYQPNGGQCQGNISNGDLKLDSIFLPQNGRQFSASSLASIPISFRVKNLDDVPIGNFDVSYQINNGAYISQHISTAIPAQSTATISFPSVDFSLPNVYQINAVVKNNATDPNSINDTLRKTLKQLTNAPINLATPFVENFDAAPTSEISTNTIGINGLDRWDFFTNTSAGRVRTFIDNGMARSGNNALFLDVNKFIGTGSSNYAMGTFNLSNYTNSDEIRADIYFKIHGSSQVPGADNNVWFRPNENAPWVLVGNYTQGNTLIQSGQWYIMKSLNLSKTYNSTANQISSTAQIKIGQNSVLGIADNSHYAGISVDDIKLYKVARDFTVNITSPIDPVHCSTTGGTPVSIRVSSTLANGVSNNIPVKLQVDGGTIFTEIVSCVGGYNALCGSENFTFSATANIASYGMHTIKVWVDDATDDYRGNDTDIVQINTVPPISSFPYLQDFENGNGNFFANGINNSWQLGQPQGIKIKTAASGSHAWKTNLTGQYNDEEQSYLYTPCFNVAGLTNPTLSFAMAYFIEYCRPDACDAGWVEYSTDGITWTKLGTSGQGTNWYNNTTTQTWDSAKTFWHVATIPLPKQNGLRLRFCFSSDTFTGYDGMAIDDIHVYDKAFDIFENNGNNSNIISQNISGNSIINFTDGNQVLASILPNNNNLGNTTTKAWINNAAIRNNGNQYFADRNITIQPNITTATSPATVRFYFTDKEVDTLRKATGCTNCAKIKDYTQLGITQYHDANIANENGTLADDSSGSFSFLQSNLVRKIPYAQGYYAEFNVNNFSEFWLNAPVNQNLPCPNSNFYFVSGNAGVGNIYQWQMDNGSGYTNISDNAIFSGTNSDTLKLNNPPSNWYGYKFKCLVPTAIYTNENVLKFVDTWTGLQNNAWENPANWGCAGLPDANTDVVINSGTVVVSSNVSIRSLKLSAGVSFTVKPGYVFKVLK